MNKVYVVVAIYEAYGDRWTEIRKVCSTKEKAEECLNTLPSMYEYCYDITEVEYE